MAIPLLDSLRSSLRRKALAKRVAAAHTWPLTTGEVNQWKVQQAEEDTGSFSSGYQLEAAFHFTLNGDYYGGYLYSIPMSHHDAETLGAGTPTVHIRYNPSNPDDNQVLAEDNAGNLPFQVASP